MPFRLDSPFLVHGGMVEGANVCEQEREFYLVRLESTGDVGPLPFTALGPYVSVDEALAHVGDMPPPPPPPPMPPLLPPGGEPEPT